MLVFLFSLSNINFVNAIEIPTKTGCGFCMSRIKEFGWEWNESLKKYTHLKNGRYYMNILSVITIFS